MQRRFALPIFAAVCLAALPGIGMAQQTGAPGTITTVAGTGDPGTGDPGDSPDGRPANQTNLSGLGPESIAVDAAGHLFIAVYGGVLKVSPAGRISTVAGSDAPGSIALDQAGNLFIKEGRWEGPERVRKLSPAGLLTLVAGTGTYGFSGDGGPATEARLWGAAGALAVDAAGNLYTADFVNHRIRKVSPDGIITTVAGSGPTGPAKGASTGDGGLATEARLKGPWGLALDRSGNLFVSEAGSGETGYRVRKVSPAGIITTVAGSDAPGFSGDGGPATQARLSAPAGIAVDMEGNLFIADLDNHRIRKVDANGIITTVAGNGTDSYARDGVLATKTGLVWPEGLAVDAVGNLLIADMAGYRVLKVFGVAAPGLIGGEPFPSP
jgi:sugar lactone lactonase YvrE